MSSRTNSLFTGARLLTVLHVAPTPFFADRGGHMRIRGIISALDRKAIKNILCTYHHGRNVPGIEIVRIARIPGYTKEEAGPSAFKYLADILLFFKSCVVACNRRPDIIHGHLHEGALIGWCVKTCFFWRKMALVCDLQGSLVGELAAHGYFKRIRPFKGVFWLLEYFIARLPNHFFCSSTSAMQVLHSQFRVPTKRISLLNDAADVDMVDATESAAFRAQLNLPADKAVVIYTGGLSLAKGLDMLCKIVLQTHKRSLDCHFLIVGYPDHVMRDFIHEYALQNFCTSAGRVPYERLQYFLAIASMAIDPKLADSGEASGKLLNYMGAGLPIICFDTQSNRQILNKHGYYAKRGSVSDFVGQIEAIVKAPEEAMRQGAAGYARAQSEFSWDAGADKIYSVYWASLGISNKND